MKRGRGEGVSDDRRKGSSFHHLIRYIFIFIKMIIAFQEFNDVNDGH